MTADPEHARDFTVSNLLMSYGSAEGIGGGESSSDAQTEELPVQGSQAYVQQKHGFGPFEVVRTAHREVVASVPLVVREFKLAWDGIRQKTAHLLSPVAPGERSIHGVDKALGEGTYKQLPADPEEI